MTWFKVDDSFYRSRKVRKLGRDRVPAVGLWTLCGDWAADNLTDGFVPWEVVEDWDPDRHIATRLLDVALWFVTEQEGEDGVQFHDWSDWQPTRDQVVQRRKADAERRARWRETKRHTGSDLGVTGNSAAASRAESRRDADRDTARESQAGSQQVSLLPDPTRPDPKETPPTPVADAPAETDPFDEFWAAYPRSVEKRGARRAWQAALKRKASPETMIAAASAYAARCSDTEPRFIKHPASWLNAGAYEDERPVAVQAPASFEDIRTRAAAKEAAQLISELYMPAPRPRDAQVSEHEWSQCEAVAFIDEHAAAIRAALDTRRTG